MGNVRIETFYNNEESRSIDTLSTIYNDKQLIKDKIKKIGIGFLDDEKIFKQKNILIKPNWVLHNHNDYDDICLRTNNSIIIALLEILLPLNPQKIVIGDAPIQRCNWDKMITKTFINEINKLSLVYKTPIEIKDFRRVTFDPKLNNPQKGKRPLSEYIIFDLGEKSYLEPISVNKNNFRVTNYNPDRLAESHRKGVHKYCISKEIFEADVVISMPKIKTHQKAGITCALKNLVGINGDKDYLPHHRIGGKERGGDCYPGKNIFRLWSEYLLDAANRRQGKITYYFFSYTSAALWKLTKPKKEHNLSAGWYGNDTTWRMVLDLNKIAKYGKKDGTLSEKPQRVIYSLCDGIIGGQGDGPLNPAPLPLGILAFGDDSYLIDLIVGNIFRLNIGKIPLLKEAQKMVRDYSIYLNGKKISIEEINDISLDVIMPPGWTNYNK
jgi:uncharacterized protein (DUF362 family)